MRTPRALILAILAGSLVIPPETSRAEVICGKERPLKPVRFVCGKLIDQSGGPVSGALVKVNRDGAAVATGTTDSDGKFLFPELKSGDYELAADFDGLRPFRSQIVVAKPERKCRHKLVVVMVLSYPDNC